MENNFERSIQALGNTAFKQLQNVNIILFGVGGVGGWCAEALVRTGVQHLTIVDFDTINPSNINRQVVATTRNIGQHKVEAMRERLLSINPQADIVAVNERYSADTAELFDFNQYDYVIDAIDSVRDKVLLITQACGTKAEFFSSMGAGRKLDPTAIRVSAFKKVEGCPLARAVRHQLKSTFNLQPSTLNFRCVWSPELSTPSGTIAPVVGVFGMTLANLVIQHILTSPAT